MLLALCAKGRLRGALTEQRATDLLLLLAGPDVYQALVASGAAASA